MVKAKVYVEGGGDGNMLRTKCRRAFREFLEKAGLEGRISKIVACGSRRNAYDDFCTALGMASPDEFVVLLVDSEAPVEAMHGPWQHLKARPGDNWDRPPGATDENAHLMVQCMEAWFLADRGAVADFYGNGFLANSLPANPNVEEIPKGRLMNSLAHAVRHTRKGSYDKGSHSFEILAELDPDLVCNVSAAAKRLVDTLRTKTV